MNTCPAFDHLVVLPRLRVQNANAISSPLTHGFPSITAFLGLAWALERRARGAGLDLRIKAVGVICHDHEEQASGDRYVKTFHLTRNPVDKNGSTAAIVEEGRIHLTLSLVLAVASERWRAASDAGTAASDLQTLAALLAGLRVAGGSCLPAPASSRRQRPLAMPWTGNHDDRTQAFRRLRQFLLPGFALVSRDDLLDIRLAELQASQPESTRLDAWLSLSRVNWRWHAPAREGDQPSAGGWRHDRSALGWVVPIPVGYGALGELHAPGTVANARDASTPFRFVESVYSVGQWIAPNHLDAAEQLLWYADHVPESGLYRCRNDFAASRGITEHAAWGGDDESTFRERK